ncbi:alpha/beta hydrolase family protein [Chitinophaga qingshengii]|uniref:Alpha/beta fold hydrolase n=1 Tax=Chitinophaga qingshengii TaxID=1569794 RepID=A0ABR7TK28_9BACT|nr:alpha/beta fold hydrolase [Chitinophaga qingshengii]MBC9929774.1 alpha/beta fold hydrolase [Chitinophaga qingshengii]
MKRYYFLLMLLVINFSLKAQDLKGFWIGTLKLMGEEPPEVAFEITANAQGQLQSRIHILNQKVFDVATEHLVATGGRLEMDIPAMSTRFEGSLVNDSTISGFFLMNDKRKFTLNLGKRASLPVAKLKRPQEPVPPLPYQEEDILFPNTAAGVTLAGTLSLPAGKGPFPAVVLISGSGANDRNETIFTHKVFLVLADYLTRAGIAVLRADDRGVGKSTGDYESATNEDLAADALAGVQYLHTRKEILSRGIGLIGHSLGGDIAPIAALSPEVAYAVLMAGTASDMETAVKEAVAVMGERSGATPAAIKINARLIHDVFSIIKSEPNDSVAKIRIAAALLPLDKEIAQLSARDREIMELTQPLHVEEFLQFLSGPRRADLLRNQAGVLKRVKCPVLAINGSKDVQVLPKELKRIEKALKAGGNQQVTIKAFEGKNHLFQNAKTGLLSEYPDIEETIAPDVLAYVAAWIKNKVQ